MKTHPDWFKTLAEIKLLWPGWTTNETQLAEWTSVLGHQRQEVVRLAISRHYRECTYREPRLTGVLKHISSIMRERDETQKHDSSGAKRIAIAKHDSSVQHDQAGMRRELAEFPDALRSEFLQIARLMCGRHIGEIVADSDVAIGLSWAAMKCGASLEDARTEEGRKRVAEVAVAALSKLEAA